jgi:hypothetical protein
VNDSRVDFFANMLDLPEEILGKLAEEGQIGAHRADSRIYFLREKIEELTDRQIAEIRREELCG